MKKHSRNFKIEIFVHPNDELRSRCTGTVQYACFTQQPATVWRFIYLFVIDVIYFYGHLFLWIVIDNLVRPLATFTQLSVLSDCLIVWLAAASLPANGRDLLLLAAAAAAKFHGMKFANTTATSGLLSPAIGRGWTRNVNSEINRNTPAVISQPFGRKQSTQSLLFLSISVLLFFYFSLWFGRSRTESQLELNVSLNKRRPDSNNWRERTIGRSVGRTTFRNLLFDSSCQLSHTNESNYREN